jgi:hypothetical protein
MRFPLPILAVLIFLLPSTALASDMSGLVVVFYFFYVILPFSIVNSVAALIIKKCFSNIGNIGSKVQQALCVLVAFFNVVLWIFITRKSDLDSLEGILLILFWIGVSVAPIGMSSWSVKRIYSKTKPAVKE